MIEKVKSTLYLIIDGVLLVIIMLLAVIIADIASNIGTPEILEIKHDVVHRRLDQIKRRRLVANRCRLY